ncbi:hypothetical protein Kpol_1056p26 [Vanderwaltozyma polyspora DSM 70294]|uniref:Asparagine--tRNA ligase, mitochondrial n=1 Tax=Vanderwaltozyma polyspora (strain ATCC 22028 / DSM 70294 / BCRC 21397 / CBS 2163 / NBRC 10782 / NRRL Y-8283 / UCD 57-17) TaxID=436907 RepID=A7TLN3_VANPO|nr:uncharacterized protein Kpol_1056p26 [Vanderwaltozyma polyspora DSM 70294]EDO16825.1 hypothetical protein Kpol_1056p26 [Vanderwaltozyma polyspora DSM 70294]
MFGRLLCRRYHVNSLKSLYGQVDSLPSKVSNINGWIKSVRLLKKVAFIDIQDGTILKELKIVVPFDSQSNLSSEVATFLKSLRTGQSIAIKDAKLVETEGREQRFELNITDPIDNISIIGNVSESYPLQKKYHSLPYLRTLPTLKHRTSYLGSLLRFRSELEYNMATFFKLNQFTKASPPILTGSDCEGAGELFRVEANGYVEKKQHYFGKPTYLTVSLQLQLEILAMAFSRAWSLSPCFRAEESDTNRHLSEFWMMEAEWCFTKDTKELTTFVKDMIQYITRESYKNFDDFIPKNIPENCLPRNELLERWETLLRDESWNTITYTEAIEILQKRDKEVPFPNYRPIWGEALQSEHERWLSESYFKGPTFVTDYPRDCKAFYMKLNPDGQTVACFDLLVPGIGEIVGGSIREDNFELLSKEVSRRQMNKNGELDWYLSLRKEGSVPHGGFGLGLERFVSYLYGNHNIRDAIPFYRAASGNIDL